MRFILARNARQKITLLAGFGLLLLAVIGGAAPKAYASSDCGPNAIMSCGFSSSSNFISQVRANNDSNGKDLPTIYDHFGLSKSDYDRFASTAKSGTVYKDGRIVVNGQTVTTSANSLGRTTLDGRHNKSMSIGSKTYYYGQTSRVFLSNSIPAKVMFDENGEVEFAVLTDCGNPVWGKNVPSSATCNSLKAQADTSTPGKYNFTTDASKTGNAVITKYVYDFGDGNLVTKTSGTTAVPYTFTAGTHTVTVTVYATLPGGTIIKKTCQTTVTVVAPDVPICVSLVGPNPQGLKYTFTATAKYGTGTTFVSGDFDFGDGKTMSAVKPTTPTTITVDHTYDKTGTYSVSAVLRFTVDGKTVTAAACNALVKPAQPPVSECKPGIPVGDVRCNPCPYDASIPADDDNCKEAVTATLPNTGAGNVIAIGSAALVGGFLFYRHRVFKRHKAAFAAAENGASPLPLADPLAPTDPLGDTPLEPSEPQAVRSTFRRRRQF